MTWKNEQSTHLEEKLQHCAWTGSAFSWARSAAWAIGGHTRPEPVNGRPSCARLEIFRFCLQAREPGSCLLRACPVFYVCFLDSWLFSTKK